MAFVLLVVVMASSGALAQTIATSTVAGRVTAVGGGDRLPGVRVTATSPRLQGPRSTVTDVNGAYLIPFLPPGDYAITFEIDKMRTRREELRLTADMTDTLDVELALAAVGDEIVVTAEKSMTAPIEATAVSANFKQDLIEVLPVGRSLSDVTLLAPGVNAGGPSGNIIISGAMSYDSLYLVNGVIVNENLRGQPHGLYIEDAIQETTIFTGGISAEYGHFTGGVVNMLTKSGGNRFSGSFRATLRNESWTEPTALTVEQEDTINPTYELTLGGPFRRDRLWFFVAGRQEDLSDIGQTSPGWPMPGDRDANGVPYVEGEPITPITHPFSEDEVRAEAKLTFAVTNSHRVVASYTDVDVSKTNYWSGAIMDLRSLVPESEREHTLMALNYNGVLTENLFLEAQYSKKDSSILRSDPQWYDNINGTLLGDRLRRASFWSPYFRTKPEGERRDHELYALNGSYFLSTDNLGTHEFKAGYERFSEVRNVNNYQNGSDYQVSFIRTLIRGDQIFPMVPNFSSYTRISWLPIFVESDGSNYATDAIYLNDRWVLGRHWTFNLGVRYDKNDAVSGDGTFQIADDSAISPRIAANFDVFGDGKLKLVASYGQYVGRLTEGVGNDGDPAGRTASFQWNYRGPAMNIDVNAPTEELVPTDEVLEIIFDWFFANGGTDMRPLRRSPSIPGFARILDPNGLKSPNVEEWTLGVGATLGTRGMVRADIVHRNWDDFYIGSTNMETGQVDFEGREYDLTIVGNDSNLYGRTYTGLHTQARYRFSDRFNAGLSWTLSKLEGNVNGENSSNGPIRGSAGQYPEYRDESWNYPTGPLTGDRRHRAKLWGTYDLPTGFGDFTFGLMQTFESGTRSSTDGTIDPRPYVDNPGYSTPPSGISYFFGGRGDLESDDITRTDISVNYALPIKMVDVFVQFEVFNIFNEQAVVTFDEVVLTAKNASWLAPFDPWTETPLECPQGAAPAVCEGMGAHFQLGPNFGEPDSESDYQTPRTFVVSLGLRF